MKMKESDQTEQKSWMTAITFAEAGEWDTALEMMPTGNRRKDVSPFFSTYAAVAFAEEGMPEEAIHIMKAQVEKTLTYQDVVVKTGLVGIRMTYGVLAVKVNR